MKIFTLSDFIDDSLGALLAHVIDNDIGPEAGIHVRISTAQTSTSAGNDNRLAIKANLR